MGKSIVLDGESHHVAGIVPASPGLPYAAGAEVFRLSSLSQAEQVRRMGNYNYNAVIRVDAGRDGRTGARGNQRSAGRFLPA